MKAGSNNTTHLLKPKKGLSRVTITILKVMLVCCCTTKHLLRPMKGCRNSAIKLLKLMTGCCSAAKGELGCFVIAGSGLVVK